MKDEKWAWILGFFAYVLWGTLPLFWRHLSHVDATTVVAHRVLWSAFSLLLVLGCRRPTREAPPRYRGQLRWYTASALVLSLNWGTYVWAVSHNYLLASSLGYFMAPLFYVAAGVFYLGEGLTKVKLIATVLGFCALIPLVHGSDLVTLAVAVLLATSIVVYGLLRKQGSLGALHGLAVESLVMVVPATVYLLWTNHGYLFPDAVWSMTSFLLIAAGPLTLLPLICFNRAVRILPLTSIGFLQYVSPMLQFLLAVFAFGELVGTERLVAFALVWFGISILVGSEVVSKMRPSKICTQ